jgi:hypothetical protein
MSSRDPLSPRQRSLAGAKVAIAVVGIATWFYGYYSDEPRLTALAIGFLAVAFALRFVGRNPSSPDE